MKKKECIVHIGMPKTGSSSIQSSLHKQLESEVFSYFNLGPVANHRIPIICLFSNTPRNFRFHNTRNFTKNEMEQYKSEIKDRLIENIDTCKNPVMILSGETIPILSKTNLEEFRDFLHQYFEKITIVSYVRTPDSFITSSFQQVVKAGVGKFDVEKRHPNYRKRFEKFDLVFGRENVQFWKFDPKDFPQQNVVLDFCSRLGIEMKEEQTIRKNESLSKEAFALLFIYRKYGPGYGDGRNALRENNNLINTLRNIGKTKISFSPSLINPILEKNKEDLLWMEERLGEKLTKSMNESSDDIKNETDLLMVDDALIVKLKDMIGYDYLPKIKKGNRVEEVADLIHALRMKLAMEVKTKR